LLLGGLWNHKYMAAGAGGQAGQRTRVAECGLQLLQKALLCPHTCRKLHAGDPRFAHFLVAIVGRLGFGHGVLLRVEACSGVAPGKRISPQEGLR
jgi:hypothetical protein